MNCNFGQRFYIQQNKNYKVNRNILEKMEKNPTESITKHIKNKKKDLYRYGGM